MVQDDSNLDHGAIEYWTNRRRQLQRCQANHPLSYEAFLRANQPAEGHPADDTWDYGQLYRLHMIRAQAAQEFESHAITEDDIDNYLIRSALADNQLDNDERSSRLYDLRRVPGGKRTTTDEEENLPSIAANTEANSRGNIERQHGSNLDDKTVQVPAKAQEPKAHPEHIRNCGYRSAGHNHA